MKRIYIDLDGVLVDYKQGVKPVDFSSFEPMEDAVRAFDILSKSKNFDVYILSTAPWSNIEAWSAKRVWVEKYLGDNAFKRLILSHNKGLLKGDYIIDDRTVNGVSEFEGEHIHFGHGKFQGWIDVLDYLI